MVTAMAAPARAVSQLDQARQQLRVQAAVLGQLVARMQRRELDRDARPRHQLVAARGRDDRVDRMPIGQVVALGVAMVRAASPSMS